VSARAHVCVYLSVISTLRNASRRLPPAECDFVLRSLWVQVYLCLCLCVMFPVQNASRRVPLADFVVKLSSTVCVNVLLLVPCPSCFMLYLQSLALLLP
jgi:hypothetical protein